MVKISLDLLLYAYLKSKYDDDPFYDFRGVMPHGLGVIVQDREISIFYDNNTVTLDSQTVLQLITNILRGKNNFIVYDCYLITYNPHVRTIVISNYKPKKENIFMRAIRNFLNETIL